MSPYSSTWLLFMPQISSGHPAPPSVVAALVTVADTANASASTLLRREFRVTDGADTGSDTGSVDKLRRATGARGRRTGRPG